MSVKPFDYLEVNEIIDFLATISLCYHFSQGNARKLKKCARAIKSRCTTKQPKKYCDAVINEPEEAFFIINTICQGHFSILAIRDNSKQFD